MSADSPASESIIWATRGHTWGSRFLLRGGLRDPLLEYERVMGEIPGAARAWGRVRDLVGVRFPDPEGRRDESGRVIPQQFVVSGELASQISSVDDCVECIWPLVEGVYATVWRTDDPPLVEEVEAIVDRHQARPS